MKVVLNKEEQAGLIHDIAEMIMVLNTRDKLPIEEHHAYERSRSIVVYLIGQTVGEEVRS